MFKLYKNTFLTILFFAVSAITAPLSARADMGADIVGANCNAGADPALDYLKNNNEDKSCVGQNISMNGFKVRVNFDGHGDFAGMYSGLCSTIYGSFFTIPCGTQAAINRDVEVGVAKTESTGSSPFGTAIVNFTTMIEGDKLCVYASPGAPLSFMTFKASRTEEFNKRYFVNADGNKLKNTDGSLKLPSHCLYMPHPLPPVKPVVPSFVSKTCIDYDTTASQFKWPDGRSRSFTGVVVQCVEETMNNLFFNKHGTSTKSVFQKTRDGLKDITMLLLVLYVIFYGFKYIRGDGTGSFKQEEWIKMLLSVGLVAYFALGSGLVRNPGETTRYFPDLFNLIDVIKTTSNIVVQAAAGVEGDRTASEGKLIEATNEYRQKQSDYNLARARWGIYNSNLPNFTQAEKDNRKTAMDDALKELKKAASNLESKKLDVISFGYNYCNFKPFETAGKYNYTYKAEDGTTKTKDMRFMSLWDSIDCRIQKYVGVGNNANAPSYPHSLMMMLAAFSGMLVHGPIGLIVFSMLFVFIIFIIFIILRIVQIYIMAYVGLILLFYISPLIVPLFLFEYTKGFFNKWFTQIIAYAIQPVILFAFLALMFAIFDTVIYGSNYEFNPSDKSKLVTSPSLNDNTVKRFPGRNGEWGCKEPERLGCVYDTIDVSHTDMGIFGAVLFGYYNLSGKKNLTQYAYPNNDEFRDGAFFDQNIKRSENTGVLFWGDSKLINLLKQLLILTLVTFVVHALLGQVEEVSKTLVNAAGNLTGMASFPSANPLQIANKTAIPALNKIASGAKWAGRTAIKSRMKSQERDKLVKNRNEARNK